MSEVEEEEEIWEDDEDDVRDEYSSLRAEVGDCIHSWCSLEDALVAVLSWALNTPEHKAGIVFAGVASFAVKLGFIDELMQNELEDRPELAFWKSVVPNLKALSAGRNVLAHHAPVTRLVSAEADPVKMKTVISPNNHDPRRRMAKRRGFTLTDTRILAMEIKRHTMLLEEFVCHLDETQLRSNTFHKAGKKLELFDELKRSPEVKGKTKKKRPTERKKRKPGVWFTGKPEELEGWLAERMKEME